MRITFTTATGVTIDTVPSKLLAISTQTSMDSGFTLYTQYPRDEIETILREEGFTNYRFGIGYIMVSPNDRVAEGVIPPQQAPVAEGVGTGPAGPVGPVPTALDPNPAEATTQAPAALQAEQAPAQARPAPVPEMYEDADPEDLDPEDDPDEVEEPPEREFTPHLAPVVDISDEELMMRLPALVSLEQASAVKLYNDKVREYERVWSQAITLKRTLDQMMSGINETEIVKKVQDDIAYLNDKCDDVESVRFESGPNVNMLVITTHEIVTTNGAKYGQRTIGKMRVSIDMRYLYAKDPPGTNYAAAIQLMNLDRHPHCCGSYWDCGHVYHEHEDGPMHVCFGGFYQHIFEAFVSRELSLLFDTIMRFVKNPNETDEWGRHVRLFPEVGGSE